jgi:GNAT superfamily N-acetyltransferase
MTFELTDSLSAEIVFAMENQESSFAFSALDGTLVPAESVTVDEDSVYSLPEWTSADGYKMREDFVSGLHVPLAYAELKNVLTSGRGVFRNFKNVLKAYPEVDRKWHFFKEKRMRSRLFDWYNSLRESWGLEQLDQNIEECDDLIYEDFVFCEYNPGQDSGCIHSGITVVAGELESQWPGEIGLAIAEIWQRQCMFENSIDMDGFVCRTLSDDFAGCILTAPCPLTAKKTVSLTAFFVVQNYRGLGIGRELFSRCLSRLRERGIQWVVIANTIVPQTVQPLLTRMGFEQIGSGFVADLCKS